MSPTSSQAGANTGAPAPLPGVSAERLRDRLRRLEQVAGRSGLRVHRADGPWARLVGLAGLAHLPAGSGLLLERTRSVHTFGMRFALDLVWLRAGRVVRIDRSVPARRLRSCRGADAVVELGGGQAKLARIAVGARLLERT